MNPAIVQNQSSFLTGDGLSGLRRLPPALNIPGKKRYVKECLRVGRWLAWPGTSDPYWEVTPEILDQLEKSFSRLSADGFDVWLKWEHFDGIHDPRNGNVSTIEPIRYMWNEGERLYFGVHLTDEQFEQVKPFNTSIKATVNFVAGEQYTYPGWSPVHVALVERATVPGQKPFVQLDAKTEPTADNETDMDFTHTVNQINRLLEFINPDAVLTMTGENSVTEENLAALLEQAVNSAVGKDSPEDMENEDMPLTEAELGAIQKMISTAVSDLHKTLEKSQDVALAAKIGEIRAVDKEAYEARQKQEKFEAELNAAKERGVVESFCDHVAELGAKYGYDPSFLDVLKDAPTVKLGSQLGAHVTATAPKVPNSDPLYSSPEEIAEFRKTHKLGKSDS